MALTPTLEEQQLLADTFRQAQSRLAPRERLTETLVAAGFAVAVAALWRIDPPRAFALLPAAVCLLLLALATRVRFDTPFGFTVASQLAFVPLLFAVPAAVAPVAVVVALILSRLPEVLAGKLQARRLLLEVGNSWFAIGPAAVFAVTDIAPADAGPIVLVGALSAQFAVDFAVSTLRFWMERAATLAAQLRETWVYAIDAALSGIALVVAEAIHKDPVAGLAPLPPSGPAGGVRPRAAQQHGELARAQQRLSRDRAGAGRCRRGRRRVHRRPL